MLKSSYKKVEISSKCLFGLAFSTTKSTSSLLQFGFFTLFAYLFKNQFKLQLYNKLQKPSLCDEAQINFDLLTHFILCLPSFPSFYIFLNFVSFLAFLPLVQLVSISLLLVHFLSFSVVTFNS